MQSVRLLAVVALSGLSAMLTLGCAPARMALVPTIAAVPPLPVQGRNTLKWSEDFSFGPWAARGVERGWRSTTTWNIIGVSSAKTSQKFEFQVAREGRVALLAQGTTGASEMELSAYIMGVPVDVNLKDEASLAVSFQPPDSTDPTRALRLVVTGLTTGLRSGAILVPGGAPIRITGTQAVEGSSIPLAENTGFTFERDGRTLGAVEVLNAGRVWLDPALSDGDREALAAAATALLLYRGPELPER